MADTNPLETTLQSTSGKVAVGSTIASVILGAVYPFLPDVQKHLSEGNWKALLAMTLPIGFAVWGAVRVYESNNTKKVAMIQANSLPMSNQPKV